MPLVVQTVSRLLVECNRSLDHERLFSEFSAPLPDTERDAVVKRYWRAHRDRVRALVAGADGADGDMRTVHVGVHTFTPVWRGTPRATDIGFLFDPRRPVEARLARAWRAALRASIESQSPGRALELHLNRPYRGWTDGLVTTLRGEFAGDRYAGIELEVSQGLREEATELGYALGASLVTALETLSG